ncbi:MAG: hypothetical protein PHX80_05380 [Candidatus Nanoarchaeia archaeon]|nr:hypothetical protein [Candidatus Nanoarchaeia archaeon]
MDKEEIKDLKKFIKTSIKSAITDAMAVIDLNQDSLIKNKFEKLTTDISSVIKDLQTAIQKELSGIKERIEKLEKMVFNNES